MSSRKFDALYASDSFLFVSFFLLLCSRSLFFTFFPSFSLTLNRSWFVHILLCPYSLSLYRTPLDHLSWGMWISFLFRENPRVNRLQCFLLSCFASFPSPAQAISSVYNGPLYGRVARTSDHWGLHWFCSLDIYCPVSTTVFEVVCVGEIWCGRWYVTWT